MDTLITKISQNVLQKLQVFASSHIYSEILITNPFSRICTKSESKYVYIYVEQNLQKLFKNATYAPESRLSGDILSIIEHKSAQITKWKTFGYLGMSILSLSGSIFSIKILVGQFIKSGFYSYLSLAFSDSGVIATYWKEYTLSLVDSLPVVSLVLSFFLLFILFISIRRFSYQFKNRLSIA